MSSRGATSPVQQLPSESFRPPSPRRRDAAAGWMASSVWSCGGESYAEQFSSAIGSAGQDLHRYTEGPSAYINGWPNAGEKSSLERRVHLSPRGRFTQGVHTGPAQYTQILSDRKMACRRTAAGPDPYGLGAANLWSMTKPAQRAYATFAPENGSRRTPHIFGRTAAQSQDAYHVSSRNQWRHTSTSIKSILAPPMPQTPHGSSLLPINSSRAATAYSRMRQPCNAHTGGHSSARLAEAASLRFSTGNPFH